MVATSIKNQSIFIYGDSLSIKNQSIINEWCQRVKAQKTPPLKIHGDVSQMITYKSLCIYDKETFKGTEDNPFLLSFIFLF